MDNQQTAIRSRAWPFYAVALLNSLFSGLTGPMFVVYLLSIHLNAAHIGLLLAIQRIAVIVFEFPTGIFADRYGRKKSLLVSFALLMIVLIVWFFINSFWVFLILSALWGLAFTFQSGARDALMIDALKLERDDALRQKIFTRFSVFQNIGFLAGGLLAAVIALSAFRSIWLSAAALQGILFLSTALFIQEHANAQQQRGGWQDHLQLFFITAKKTIRDACTQRNVLILLSITMLVSAATAVYGLSYPLLLKTTIHLSDYQFGFLGSLSALVGIGGSLLGEKISRHRGQRTAIIAFALSFLLFFFLFGFQTTLLGLLLVFIFLEAGFSGWYPLFQSYLNGFLPSENRASLLSFISVAGLLAIALSEMLAGTLLTRVAPGSVIVWTAVLFLIVPLLVRQMKRVA